MKISLFFAWYDFWVGFFYDRKQQTLYICPLPCVVFKVVLKPKKDEFNLKQRRFYETNCNS